MEKSNIFKQDRNKVHKIVSEVMRYMISILVIIWIINFYGLFNYENSLLTIYFCACGILLLVPTLLVDVLKLEHEWITYVILLCTVGVVGLLNSFLSYHISGFILFPLFIASLYNSRKGVLITTIADIIMVIGTSFLSAHFSLMSQTVNMPSLGNQLIQNTLPNVVIILGVSIIAYSIVRQNCRRIEEVAAQAETLKEAQESLIFTFSEMSENKSKVTGEHIRRVAAYMRVLGTAAGFPEDYVEKLSLAAMMHDIGKLMIPEEILDKPAKLTDKEFEIMKNHVFYGEALLANTKGEIMQMAKVIALQHHERWDGTGYIGLKGDQIEYISRMIAICDVFDALTSKRYYKEGWDLDEAHDEIVRLSGKHFDPDVVKLFDEHFVEFKEIWMAMPDRRLY